MVYARRDIDYAPHYGAYAVTPPAHAPEPPEQNPAASAPVYIQWGGYFIAATASIIVAHQLINFLEGVMEKKRSRRSASR